MTHVFTLVLLLYFSVAQLYSQEIINQDFEQGLPFDSWKMGENAELGHLIGVNKSNFFRFHPKYKAEKLTTPLLNLTNGYYRLYFNWSENGFNRPDSTIVSFSNDSGLSWNRLGRIGGGNGGLWQIDSFEIGQNLGTNCFIRFEYNGTGRFPSTYLNLDEIKISKVEMPNGLISNSLDVHIELFPNPTTHLVNLKIDNKLFQNLHYEIYDLNGKLWEKNSLGNDEIIRKQFDFLHFGKGIYFINFFEKSAQKTLKIIVQ